MTGILGQKTSSAVSERASSVNISGLATEATLVAQNGLLYVNDPMLAIAAGEQILVSKIAGYVNKFGRNSSIAAATTEEIWDGSAVYVFPATTLMTKLSQTADQAAMRGEVVEVEGLDANWNRAIQNVTLDGSDTTTPVVLTTALIRCPRMKVLADVVTDSPIRLHNDAENQDYAIIDTGNNQTLMAIYTVPNGQTAYLQSFYANVNPATNLDPTSNPIRLWARDNHNSYEKQLKHTSGLTVGHLQHFYAPYQKYTEKTDIFMTASPVGKAVDVSAGFDLILVNN